MKEVIIKLKIKNNNKKKINKKLQLMRKKMKLIWSANKILRFLTMKQKIMKFFNMYRLINNNQKRINIEDILLKIQKICWKFNRGFLLFFLKFMKS